METTNLISTDKIPLSENQRTLFQLTTFTLLLVLSGIVLSIYWATGRFFISLTSLLVLIALGVLVLQRLRHHLASGYIHNEMVIFKMLNGKNYVLEFRCIKAIRTRNLAGFKISRITFRFDGVVYHAYLCGKDDGKHGGEIIRQAMKQRMDKKKASHKPGSVHSA